jgi:hypothetical protein
MSIEVLRNFAANIESAGAEIYSERRVISMNIFHEMQDILLDILQSIVSIYLIVKTRLEIKVLKTKTADSGQSTDEDGKD